MVSWFAIIMISDRMEILKTGSASPHIRYKIEAFAQRVGLSTEEFKKRLAKWRGILLAEREQRIHPLKDDKILTAWNGLMIAALSKADQALGESTYSRAAERAADFILQNLRNKDGTLMRRYRHGHVAHSGYLDDYAILDLGIGRTL